ncbi:MAG: hypothetical protein HQM09_21520 [Candidatus Riflebacteria bacterium]|nr:hypothetical protein [Candidatus Riflebacteria bacterium]
MSQKKRSPTARSGTAPCTSKIAVTTDEVESVVVQQQSLLIAGTQTSEKPISQPSQVNNVELGSGRKEEWITKCLSNLFE